MYLESKIGENVWLDHLNFINFKKKFEKIYNKSLEFFLYKFN
jgi:hypothetical protein